MTEAEGPKPNVGARALGAAALCLAVIGCSVGYRISRAVDAPEPTPPGISTPAKTKQETPKPDAKQTQPQQQQPPAIEGLKTIVDCREIRPNNWECPPMKDGNGIFTATVTKRDGSFELAATGKTASLPESIGSSGRVKVFDKFVHECYAVATIPQGARRPQVAVGCDWKTEVD